MQSERQDGHADAGYYQTASDLPVTHCYYTIFWEGSDLRLIVLLIWVAHGIRTDGTEWNDRIVNATKYLIPYCHLDLFWQLYDSVIGNGSIYPYSAIYARFTGPTWSQTSYDSMQTSLVCNYTGSKGRTSIPHILVSQFSCVFCWLQSRICRW